MADPIAALRFRPARDVTALALIGTALFAWRWAQFARYLRIGDELAAGALAYQCKAADHGASVLVIGDSLALGTGAARPEDSIAGLLARQYPHASIVNRACNGARTVEALVQLEADANACADMKYDLILATVGGNDILKRTPFEALPAQIDALLAAACRRSDHVIVTTTPNIGLAPLFFPPLSWWLSRRSRQLRDLFAAAAERHGAHYVNFFHSRATDPFSRDWQRYFAPDRLHPSSDCYRLVYATLCAETPIAKVLGRIGTGDRHGRRAADSRDAAPDGRDAGNQIPVHAAA